MSIPARPVERRAAQTAPATTQTYISTPGTGADLSGLYYQELARRYTAAAAAAATTAGTYEREYYTSLAEYYQRKVQSFLQRAVPTHRTEW